MIDLRDNMSVKLLLVSPYSYKKVGGIGTWSKNVLDYLSHQNKIQYTFLNTAFQIKGNVVKNPFLRLFFGIIDSLYILFRYLTKLVYFKPNVIHYTSSASLALLKDFLIVFISVYFFRTKIIIHWHFGRIPLLFNENNWEWKLLLKVIKHSTYSIVIDKVSFDLLSVKLGLKNIRYIPNPISKELEEISFQKNRILDKRCDTILFVGHVIPAKGIFELVKVCSKIENVSLIIIGPCLNNTLKQLMELAEDRGNTDWIKFVGEIPREEVFRYYQESTVFCLPSYTEGFPNVVIEAMALGCPVIATNVGDIPEMLSSECGICIEPKDENQLRYAIIRALNDKSYIKRIALNAKNKVLSNYSLDKVMSQYIKLWV